MDISWLKINNSNSPFSEPTQESSRLSRSHKFDILRLTYFLILKRRGLALFCLMEISLTLYCQLRFVSIFTPSYFTLSVVYSILPCNFLLLRFQDCHFIYFTFIEILLAFNQLTTCFKSAYTTLFNVLINLLGHNRLVVSLAKW